MDPDSTIQIVLYVVFLLCGAYFAAAESAFSALNRVRVEVLADDGNKKAKLTVRILDKFDKALTTLLIGTNIAHIGCASLSTVLAFELLGRAVGEGTAATYATIITTVTVFLCSEMIPKSYAKANAEKTACALAPSLWILMVLLTPISIVFQGISTLITHLFPAKEEPTYSEDELVTLIDSAEEEGVIDEERSDILQSAIEFTTTSVKDVMTVRDDLFAIELHTPIEKVKELLLGTKHSRVPVYDTSLDKIVGILPVRTFFKNYLSKGKFNLRTILTKPYAALEDAPIQELFDRMRKTRVYMAVVRDEEGRTLGIATIEDFLEEIVGEIWDEEDEVNENFIKLGGYNYRVTGRMNVGKAFSLMKYKPKYPAVMAKSIQTWATELFGHFPEEDEQAICEGALDVTVVESDGEKELVLEIKVLDEEEREALGIGADAPLPSPEGKEAAV